MEDQFILWTLWRIVGLTDRQIDHGCGQHVPPGQVYPGPDDAIHSDARLYCSARNWRLKG
jgi:hypothetical protein